MDWLTSEEKDILLHAAAGGGAYAATGLGRQEMLRIWNAVQALKRRGLVKSTTRFATNEYAQPEMIRIELTDEGRVALV